MSQDILGLFRHVLTTSYSTFNEQVYGQMDGVAMGSPLSPVIANFYMGDYEKVALESAPLKLRCRFLYVDDTIIWQHGPDKLKDFLHHLNSFHQSIQFTMETENQGHLPFLDLDIYRRPDGSLGHKVFRNKPPLPFYQSLGPRFVLWPFTNPCHYLLTPLLSASSILNSLLASFLTWYFFAACSCWLQLALFLVHRFLSP
jgi:hypothetical protein